MLHFLSFLLSFLSRCESVNYIIFQFVDLWYSTTFRLTDLIGTLVVTCLLWIIDSLRLNELLIVFVCGGGGGGGWGIGSIDI